MQGVAECVAVSCSVLQRVADVCELQISLLRHIAGCCRVLQRLVVCVAVSCSVLQRLADIFSRCSVLQRLAASCRSYFHVSFIVLSSCLYISFTVLLTQYIYVYRRAYN